MTWPRFIFNHKMANKSWITKKSCAIQKAEDDPDSVSEDDLAFWSFVREEERPSTMRGVQEREAGMKVIIVLMRILSRHIVLNYKTTEYLKSTAV